MERVVIKGNSYKVDKLTADDYRQLTGKDDFKEFLKSHGIVRFRPINEMTVPELQEYLDHHKIDYDKKDTKEVLLSKAK